MPYSAQFIHRIKALSTGSIGVRLGLWAIHHNISPTKIAMATGATRQSVYNWMKGGGVLRVYEDRIHRLIECMKEATTQEDAWRKICREFDLRT